MQFTYICKSQGTHVICINGTNFNITEFEGSDINREHGRFLRIDSIIVFQTLHVRLDNHKAVHLAEVVRAIEIARFIWTHWDMLKLGTGKVAA